MTKRIHLKAFSVQPTGMPFGDTYEEFEPCEIDEATHHIDLADDEELPTSRDIPPRFEPYVDLRRIEQRRIATGA